MIRFEPSRTATWQLPWLRVALIIRTMAGNADCRPEDLGSMLVLRQRLTQRGWFN
jgi:hypothetical protein